MRATRSSVPWLAGLMVGGLAWAGCSGDDGAEPVGGPDPFPQYVGCALSETPIVRLTADEYENTIAALFPGVPLSDVTPVPDERIGGFIGHHDGQSISALGVSRYEELARAIGEAAAANLAAWAPCVDDSAACLEQIALDLAFKTHRRPLDDADRDALVAFVADSYGQFGMSEGAALVIQGLLESPRFLFRPQFGTGAVVAEGFAAGGTPLDDYEMASRLSYFFLDTMPDGELFAAAEAGELTTDAGLEAHARRLLADERARPVINGFFGEWLRLYELDELALDPGTFPEFDEALRLDLEASARAYLDKAIWEDDSWASLMGGSYGFVNDRLAPIFGIEPPGSEALTLVELDAAQRRGILTQPALLSSTSHGIQHSPIYRGVTMLESVLCSKIPAPPPGVLDNLDDDEPVPADVCTVRDQISRTHTVGADCQGCHQAIDGAGFTFENYDALGRYRTEENGCPVDPSGNFPGTLGQVANAVDMANRLVTSPRAAECMSSHLLRFGLSRSDSDGDECQVKALGDALLAGNGSLQESIVQLVLSPVFRHRPVVDPTEGT